MHTPERLYMYGDVISVQSQTPTACILVNCVMICLEHLSKQCPWGLLLELTLIFVQKVPTYKFSI